MIELQNICRIYGNKTVLDNLSFRFPDKGAFCIYGASGCGKTTLLRLLANVDAPSSGSILSTHKKTAVEFPLPFYI